MDIGQLAIQQKTYKILQAAVFEAFDELFSWNFQKNMLDKHYRFQYFFRTKMSENAYNSAANFLLPILLIFSLVFDVQRIIGWTKFKLCPSTIFFSVRKLCLILFFFRVADIESSFFNRSFLISFFDISKLFFNFLHILIISSAKGFLFHKLYSLNMKFI